MWSTIILNCVLSITIIFIANQLWDYCKNNYTSQKTKNLVEIHASKYKQIAEDMERNDQRSSFMRNSELIRPPYGESVNVVMSKNVDQFVVHNKPRVETAVRFIQKEEKEWVNKELAEFMETL
jgi:hypothetical protein